MADVSIDATTLTAGATSRGKRAIVFTTASIGYAFYLNADATFVYSKTTDGGASWGAAVTINSTLSCIGFDVWFEQWTPGDTGTLIHTWVFESTNSFVRWRSLDTNGDTFGTARTVFDGATAVAGRGAFVSGTKSRSGYLYCAYDIDAGAERGFHQSTDGGTTWSASLDANFIEATVDECLLHPATGTGDNNDIWAIYQDASANELTMKFWDNSAATTIESSSMQAMTENVTDATGQGGFTGAVRRSDGHLIVVSMSAYDNAASAMQVWDVSAVNSGSQTGITAKTNITTNIDDNYHPAICLNQYNDDIYVFYNGKRDGSETIGTSTKVYYTKSSDGGTSWSAGDTAYMEGTAGVVMQVWAPLSGPLLYAAWRVGITLNGNAVNSLAFPSTTIKTILGLAKASVKTVNGLAIASVKTVDGLA